MAASRQFARRQVTWARAEKNFLWLHRDSPAIEQALEAYLDTPRPAGEEGRRLTARELFRLRPAEMGVSDSIAKCDAESERTTVNHENAAALKKYRPLNVLLNDQAYYDLATKIARDVHKNM